jgi:hypothetical protein
MSTGRVNFHAPGERAVGEQQLEHALGGGGAADISRTDHQNANFLDFHHSLTYFSQVRQHSRGRALSPPPSDRCTVMAVPWLIGNCGKLRWSWR